jgi:hypothetical protein
MASEQIRKITELKDRLQTLNPASFKSNIIVVGNYAINGVYVGAFLTTAVALLLSWTIRIVTNKGFIPGLKHWKFWLFNLIAAISMFLANVQFDKWHGFNIEWLSRKLTL